MRRMVGDSLCERRAVHMRILRTMGWCFARFEMLAFVEATRLSASQPSLQRPHRLPHLPHTTRMWMFCQIRKLFLHSFTREDETTLRKLEPE